MAELTEQQQHLAGLLEQRQTILGEINELNNQVAGKRELLLRALGAIEYLQQVGVTLPEPEVEGEATEVSTEVVDDAPLPEPTVEGEPPTE